ncbi:hypothetical protein B0H11DRAFT_2292887 [Mycena galericulata]|nr:hypothetical protein B0H11DRAFT_2292887 [Mycena galericulata]
MPSSLSSRICIPPAPSCSCSCSPLPLTLALPAVSSTLPLFRSFSPLNLLPIPVSSPPRIHATHILCPCAPSPLPHHTPLPALLPAFLPSPPSALIHLLPSSSPTAFITPALFQPYPSAADEYTLSTLMAADGTLQSTMENHYDTFTVCLPSSYSSSSSVRAGGIAAAFLPIHLHLSLRRLSRAPLTSPVDRTRLCANRRGGSELGARALNWVRVPIPFWAISTWSDVGLAPHGSGTTVGEPFLEGVCWKYIVCMLGWAPKYGLRVNLDLHTIPGS